jgi:hypothetical protein
MEPDFVETVQIVGPGLKAFSAHAGIVFPPEVTAEDFLRELVEGAPGTPADPAFFARLVVSLMHPDLQQDQANLAEISELIQARLAARRAARG